MWANATDENHWSAGACKFILKLKIPQFMVAVKANSGVPHVDDIFVDNFFRYGHWFGCDIPG